MYFNKDAFSKAEKVNIRPINESDNILDNIDLSVSQHEIHRQLCRQGREIRDEYLLRVRRTVVTSIARLFQKCDEVKVEADNSYDLQDMWLKKMEQSAPRHMKGWIRTGGWI